MLTYSQTSKWNHLAIVDNYDTDTKTVPPRFIFVASPHYYIYENMHYIKL
jgi:hypothetical protein